MVQLPNIFTNPNEEYVTLPALKTFMKAKGITIPRDEEYLKENLFRATISYAEQSKDNMDSVFSWLDMILKEGIKEVHLKKVSLPANMGIIFANKASAMRYLESYLPKNSEHFVGNAIGPDFKMIKADAGTDELGEYVSLYFARMLHQVNIKENSWRSIEYPVIVDYYYKSGWLVSRNKSRTNLYKYHPEFTIAQQFISEGNETTSSLLAEIDGIVQDLFGLCSYDMLKSSHEIKNKFYSILDRYTHTPLEIQNKLDSYAKDIDTISNELASICGIGEPMAANLRTDVLNLVEKFISITWENKSIFIDDRDAYPIRLSATDEEESRVDQSAATRDDPLQSKAVFFDNKRMLCDQQLCDGITLVWKRKTKTYYPEDSFPVILSEKRGVCTITFRTYTAEEDIKNVLFSIIGS